MRARHQALDKGTRLGAYEIDRVLGIGAFGVTYLAHDRDLERPVAIKEYFPTGVAERDADGVTVAPRSESEAEAYTYGLGRFIEEARTLARFQHPGIARVHYFEQSNGTAYLVMEYVHGETLEGVLKRGPFDNACAVTLLSAMMGALAAVHAHQILHRDIKPANILMPPGRGPVLIDFGAARVALLGRTGNMTVILTPGYAPLEQYGDSVDLGPWTDIYAVGATLYDCLLGRPPEEAMRRLNALHYGSGDPVVSALEAAATADNKPIVELIGWMLQPHTGDRPQSCDAVLAAIAAGNLDAVAPPTGGVVLPPLIEPRIPPVSPDTAATGRWAAPAGELDRARVFLAERMGPIARILVDRAARSARDRNHFIQQIAEEIETPRDLAAWLQAFKRS